MMETISVEAARQMVINDRMARRVFAANQDVELEFLTICSGVGEWRLRRGGFGKLSNSDVYRIVKPEPQEEPTMSTDELQIDLSDESLWKDGYSFEDERPPRIVRRPTEPKQVATWIAFDKPNADGSMECTDGYATKAEALEWEPKPWAIQRITVTEGEGLSDE